MFNFGVLVFALNRIEKIEKPKEVVTDTCCFSYFGEEYVLKYYWMAGEEYLSMTLSSDINIWTKLTKKHNLPEVHKHIIVSGRSVDEMIEDIKVLLMNCQIQRALDVFDIYSDICLGIRKAK